MWLQGLVGKMGDNGKGGGRSSASGGDSGFNFVKRPSRGRISVFTSGKGGVGKSTLSSACAGLLAMAGRRVLLVDTDTGLRSVDMMFGLEDDVSMNLYDVLEGGAEWTRALLTRPDIPGLFVVVADQSRSKDSIRKDAFEKFIMNASKYFDNVLIDCPAGIEYGFSLAVGPADEAFVVTVPEALSLRSASRVVRLLEQRNISPVFGILNRRVEKLESAGLAAKEGEAEDILAAPVRCSVPMDYTVMACNHKGIPLALWDKPCEALDAIRDFVAATWLGENPLLEGIREKSGRERAATKRRLRSDFLPSSEEASSEQSGTDVPDGLEEPLFERSGIFGDNAVEEAPEMAGQPSENAVPLHEESCARTAPSLMERLRSAMTVRGSDANGKVAGERGAEVGVSDRFCM